MACNWWFPFQHVTNKWLIQAATIDRGLQLSISAKAMGIWQALLSFHHSTKHAYPVPHFKPIWSRCQSGSLLHPFVFCTIAGCVLYLSITTEKTSEGKDFHSRKYSVIGCINRMIDMSEVYLTKFLARLSDARRKSRVHISARAMRISRQVLLVKQCTPSVIGTVNF